MDNQNILHILEEIENGSLSSKEALLKLRIEPFENLGYAKVDHHRKLRQGVPEIIYGAGKTAEQIKGIASSISSSGEKNVLITRLEQSVATILAQDLNFHYYETPRLGIVGDIPKPNSNGFIVVATGGTSDIPVAEEAALTAEVLGNKVERLYDVGVAGIHRLLAHTEIIMKAQVIIAIAGMEGALASVIGGLANCPVIGVPTSVGYGTSFGGISALLSMLNSCASGVSVVNIDNGFGAAYIASMINHQPTKETI